MSSKTTGNGEGDVAGGGKVRSRRGQRREFGRMVEKFVCVDAVYGMW